MSSRSRRLRDRMMPLIAAGLIRFARAKEIEQIKLNPKIVILIAIGLSISILILNLVFPL